MKYDVRFRVQKKDGWSGPITHTVEASDELNAMGTFLAERHDPSDIRLIIQRITLRGAALQTLLDKLTPV